MRSVPLLMLRRKGGHRWRSVFGRPDPAGKAHSFVIYGLESDSEYELKQFVTSEHGLMTIVPAGVLRTGN